MASSYLDERLLRHVLTHGFEELDSSIGVQFGGLRDEINQGGHDVITSSVASLTMKMMTGKLEMLCKCKLF